MAATTLSRTMPRTDATMPLSDVTVVDLGQAIAGPICATFLADLGADVIKVERPSGDVYRIDRRERDGEGFNPPFELYNRNKRSLCLDLKAEGGSEVLYDLVADADVLVQNWPPGVAERVGVDYDALREHNEDLIYVHVSGYGEVGPGVDRPAMDTIVQHVSGLSSLMGFPGDPPIRAQSSVADFFAGYNAVVSTLAALRHRDAGGGGQAVDVSMLESTMHNMDGAFEYHHNLGEELPRGGRNGFFAPDMLYGATEAADGWVCVALLLYSERVWRAYCDLLDRPDLLEKPEYATDDGRMADAEELSAEFEDWLADFTVEEAVETLNGAGIPAAPHNTVAEAAEFPPNKARGTFVEVDHPRLGPLTLTNSPLSLSETPPEVRRHAPMLGEHSREVLAELGYDEASIDRLRESSAVLESDR